MDNENLKNERIYQKAWFEPTEIGGDDCVSKNFTRNYMCHKDEPCSDCMGERRKRIVEKSRQEGIIQGRQEVLHFVVNHLPVTMSKLLKDYELECELLKKYELEGEKQY